MFLCGAHDGRENDEQQLGDKNGEVKYKIKQRTARICLYNIIIL